MKTLLYTLCGITMLGLCANCSSKKTNEPINTISNNVADKTEKESPFSDKGPIINIQDTIEIKKIVLCLKDTAKTLESMQEKLNVIYNTKLAETIKLNKLNVTGAQVAWQSMQKNIYFFEAGIPVDKIPTKLGKGMYIKNTGTDSAIIAHFWVPVNLLKSAYDALAEMISDKKKAKSTSSYEIYVGNYYGTVQNDPYKQQTDIVMPYK
jgi:hypothetical protein